MPQTKLVGVCFLGAVFLLTALPLIYGQLATSKNIKTKRGEKSLIKSYLISQVSLPIFLLNGVLYFPKTFMMIFDDSNSSYNTFGVLPPVILSFILLFFLIANLSGFQLCKQVLKIAR